MALDALGAGPRPQDAASSTRKTAKTTPAASPQSSPKPSTAGGRDAARGADSTSGTRRPSGTARPNAARDDARAGATGERAPASPRRRGRSDAAAPDRGNGSGNGRGETRADEPKDPKPADPKRPAAGGAGNPRDRDAKETTAEDLDRRVPQAERDDRVKAQEQAQQRAEQSRRTAARTGDDPQKVYRESLGSYYEKHPEYVDPKTGEVYHAEYDVETGRLTLQRNDERQPDGTTPPPAPGEPVSPWSTADDDYHDETTGSVAGRPGGPGGQAPQEHRDDIADPHEGSPHGDAPDESAPPPAGGTPGRPNQGGQPPLVSDERIVIEPDGSRRTVTSTAPADEPGAGHPDSVVTTNVVTDSKGAEESNLTIWEATSVEDGGVVRDQTTSYTAEGETSLRWQERRDDPNGDSTVRITTQRRAGDEVLSDSRYTSATADGVELVERASTTYEDGRPQTTTLSRSARVGGEHDTSSYTLGYDERGYATNVDGPAPVDGMDPLDAFVQEHAGPLSEGETRPAFGTVRLPSSGTANGRAYSYPAYIAGIGVQTTVDGTPVFVEGDSVAASASLDRSVTALRQSWAGLPASIRDPLQGVELLQGRNAQDAYWSVAVYDTEFYSGATGGTNMTYYMNSDASVGTTRHELAHISGEGGGAPDEEAWRAAMAADQEGGVPASLAGEETRALGGANPLLADEEGVSQYADDAFAENEDPSAKENEDWAESVQMYLASRENGGLVQVREEDGKVRTYRFEELYPARAALLDEHYGLGPAPHVEPPSWPEDDGKIRIDLGSIGGGAGSARSGSVGAGAADGTGSNHGSVTRIGAGLSEAGTGGSIGLRHDGHVGGVYELSSTG